MLSRVLERDELRERAMARVVVRKVIGPGRARDSSGLPFVLGHVKQCR